MNEIKKVVPPHVVGNEPSSWERSTASEYRNVRQRGFFFFNKLVADEVNR